MKKFSKIFILLLSIALIIGAIAVVASAEAGVDNKIELYANGTLVEGVSTYEDALLTVQKGQAGGADYIVKLLGNLTTTTSWDTTDTKCYAIGANAPQGGELVDNVKRNVTIDLNGYTMDTSGVTEWAVFSSQREYRNLTVAGQGTLIVPPKTIFNSMSGACVGTNGSGYGIRITNAEGTMPWDIIGGAGSGCAFSFTNTIFDFTYEETQGSGKTLFKNGKYPLTFTNCYINLDITNKITGTDNIAGSIPHYVFELSDVGITKLYNTYVRTTTNGIYVNNAQGSVQTFGGVEDQYSLYMENSSLYCDPSDKGVEFCKTQAAAGVDKTAQYLRTVLITRTHGGDTGSIYLKDSYAGANYRLIQGQNATGDNALTDRAVLTFDHSTLEHINKAYTAAGESITNSGQGFYGNITYTNFINGSTVEFNSIGGWMCGGGGNQGTAAGSNYTGVAGAGTFFIDLAVGTRLDKNVVSGKVDIPAGTTVVSGGDGYYYVTDGTVTFKPANTKNSNGMNKVRQFGFYETNQTVGGVSGVEKWTFPTSTDTGYKAEDSHGPQFNEDGTVALVGNDTYINFGTRANLSTAEPAGQGTRSGAVAVYTFDYYQSGKFPLTAIALGRNTSAKYSNTYTLPQGEEYQNKWNTLSLVVDLNTCNTYIFLNGEMVSERADPSVYYMAEFRINYMKNTAVDQGAYFAWKGQTTYIYGSYLTDGEFVAKDYIDNIDKVFNTSDKEPVAYVGNTPFYTVSEALDFASANDLFVTLVADVTEEINGFGYVNANGHTFNPTPVVPIIMKELGNGGYLFEGPPKHNVNWVINEDTVFTEKVYEGMTLTALPEDLAVPSFGYQGHLYEFLGWTATEVPYTDVAVEDYKAAVEAATLVTEAQILAAVVTAEVNYYPVYTLTAGVEYAIQVNNNVTYYGAEDDLVEKIVEAYTAGASKVSVVLYNDMTVTKSLYAAMGTHLRKIVDIDVNGYTLSFDIQAEGKYETFVTTASGGNVILTSSRSGGKILQVLPEEIEAKNVAPLFYIHMTASITMTNVDVEAYRLMYLSGGNDVTGWANGAYQYRYNTTSATINGGTFTALSAECPLIEINSSTNNAGTKELNVKGATFIGDYVFAAGGQKNEKAMDKGEGEGTKTYTDVALWFGNDLVFENCTFITSDGTKTFYTCVMAENVVTFKNCVILGTVDATVGVTNLNGNTVAYGINGEATCTDDERSIAVKENKVTIGDKEYSVHFVVAANSEVKVATVYDLLGNLVKSIKFIDGEWTDYITVSVDPITLDLFTISHDGTWIKNENDEYRPGTVITVNEVFAANSAMLSITLEDSFAVNFYFNAEYYDYLDDASKALLSETTVTIGDDEYYYATPITRDANQAYTIAEFSITIVDGVYTHPVTYAASVVSYLADSLVTLQGDEAKLSYYVAAYLNNAYNYFSVVDDTEAQNLATIVAQYETLVSADDITLPALTTDYSAIKDYVDFAYDLKSTPELVIVASKDGTVTIGENTYEFEAETVSKFAISISDLDAPVTVTLEDGETGTYSLGDYAKNIAECETDAVYTAELKALVASLYNYVLFANKAN